MPHREHILQKVLYVTADKSFARLFQKQIGKLDVAVDIVTASEEILERIKNTDANVILLDYDLPGMKGVDLISTLVPISDYPPIIALLPNSDENVILQSFKFGAANYLVKNAGKIHLDLLYTIIRNTFSNSCLEKDNLHQRHELIIAKEKTLLANNVKGEFLANISHEIRTPMNVVMGLSRLLNNTPLNPKQTQMVEMLVTNADLLMKLIDNLLNLNDIENKHIEFEKQLFTVTSMLKAMKAMFASEVETKKLELTFTDMTNHALIISDEICIQQIVTNLISNAIKFTSVGTVRVVFEIKHEASPRLSIKVEDTGIGIKTEDMGLIFDKFSQVDQTITRRFGGSGLGLAICKSLSLQMGGDILVESTSGLGSTFSLVLPVEIIAPQQQGNKLEQDNAETNKGTILLVEDYHPNVMVASMMLDSMGFNVEVAENGMGALNKIILKNSPYTAILMDVQMPDMDGFETTKRIRLLEKEKGFKNNILGVTAHALSGDRDKCLESGMDDYMSKPIHQEILEKKISVLLEQKSA